MPTQKIRKIFESTKYSFGSTSAIITNIALIIGLDAVTDDKLPIIGSLLVIALADNISDTFGIHMYQESEGLSQRQVWVLTISNFLSRLIISLGFIFIIIAFPLYIGGVISLIYGLSVLSLVSYLITKGKKVNPWFSIIEHLMIAATVIFVSKFFAGAIINRFK